MTSILRGIETIFRNQSRSNDSRQKNFFLVFGAVLKSTLNFEHFQKNLTVIPNVFPKLRTRKEAVS